MAENEKHEKENDGSPVEIKRMVMQKRLEEATRLLTQILPMQHCIDCQELLEPCEGHADISKTIEEIELFLEA